MAVNRAAAITEKTAAALFVLNAAIAEAIAKQCARSGEFPPMSARPLFFPRDVSSVCLFFTQRLTGNNPWADGPFPGCRAGLMPGKY